VSARKYEAEGAAGWSERVAARAIKRMVMTSRPGTGDGPERAARFLAALEVARSKTPGPLPAVTAAPPAPANQADEVSDEDAARIAKMCEEDAANLEARRARKSGH
jgi:hypothetical protein